MDSQKLFLYSLPDTSMSHLASHSTFSSVSNLLPAPHKNEFERSSNSLLSHHESETFSTLSDSPEQHSSTCTTLSTIIPSSYYTLETSSRGHCRPSNLPVDYYRQNLPTIISPSKNTSCIQALETALMNTDDDVDEVTTQNASFRIQPHERISYQDTRIKKRLRVIEESSIKGSNLSDLKQLLVACAKSLVDDDNDGFEDLVLKTKNAVSVSGEPIQRIGAYLIEGLMTRNNPSGCYIHKALSCKEPESKDLLSYMHILYEACPYLKFGYMAANGAIAEACRNEDNIHIIDFQISQGNQWVTLLQALAARPSGPPHVRITGIDDPISKFARGVGLEAVERRLRAISDQFKIPFEFNGIPVSALEVTREMLDIRRGEALAVNFPLQLHRTPDEGVDVNNPRDGLLRLVKSLSPKVTTLVEQESNTNTTPLLTRFVETLDYYLAMFESVDAALPRDQRVRIDMERHCLARDIVNIIACEGKERVERHELFGKWKSRLTMAGFKQYPLSSYVTSVIRNLLNRYAKHYTLEEKDGVMLLGWKDRKLMSASAWH
ncbi:hypothetical protein SAY86_004218 [Trapa natans]|uniref:Uncharacterized protein n=1 Tax=Trapa natans TaxID=22666 RepID=A0AAN7MI85_TRANT|nr:hypothetical protein SAY86_004218 [Trapa natans]